MNKVASAFKNGKAFISFVTAGDPNLQKTEDFIKVISNSGADIIELGIPFSDPIAEGDVIQQANIRALNSGSSLDKIFEMVKRVKQTIATPIVFLTYLNPVFNYGYDKFFLKCNDYGVSALIIPDLPYEEKEEVASIATKYNIEIISLIAPTSDKRISKIASSAEGFIYCVSSLGVTGVRSNITTDLESIINVIRKNTQIPIAVGFGISTPEQATNIAKYADGVIVGSAIVKIIAKYGENADNYIAEYVKSMKEAVLRQS